jgi:hypothetical protein
MIIVFSDFKQILNKINQNILMNYQKVGILGGWIFE